MHNESGELEIAVTGSAWVGHGRRSVWAMIRDSFANAEREILIAAYSLSEASPDFFNLLDTCLVKGIRILIIINRFEEQPETAKKSLGMLRKKYTKTFMIKNFNPEDPREDLHAKLIIIDHKIALVGSANPTWKGLIINHELMIRIKGRQASEIGDLVDSLSQYPGTTIVPVDVPG